MQGYYYKELHQVDSASYYFQKVLNIGNPIIEYEANTALSETNAENREYTTAWKFLNKAIKLRNAHWFHRQQAGGRKDEGIV